MITINKPITKIVNLTLNGFHGYQSHNVRATFARRAGVEATLTPFGFTEEEESGYDVTITESAARKFGCKCSDCRCGERMPTAFVCDDYDFDASDLTVNGNYPQR
jgi:hypothetical protein